MYYDGDGVPKSSVHAYAWFLLTKTQGQADAASHPDIMKPQIAEHQTRVADSLNILKPLLTKQQIAEGQALASQCYESDYKDCD
jgi:hypothetical protein